MTFTTLTVAGDDAVRLLHEHRARYAATGQYPFLVGDATDLARVTEAATYHPTAPAEIVRASLAIDPAEWIDRRRREAAADEAADAAACGEAPVDPLGEWPETVPANGAILLHREPGGGRVKPTVCLGLAAIEEPWHLPAALKYGGWNNCPPPAAHCALFRHWQARYGAEITVASGDAIECAVSRPPTDRDGATRLAWEQYLYCPDIVEQGCDTVARLAAELLDSPYWFFWWD